MWDVGVKEDVYNFIDKWQGMLILYKALEYTFPEQKDGLDPF